MPGPVIDRKDRASWEVAGKVSIYDRAKEQLEFIKQQPSRKLDAARSKALDEALIAVAKEAGVTVPLTD